MLIDIHVHSSHSEGADLELTALVDRVKQVGLDGFCLTDMHTVAGGEEAKRLASEAGLVALVGFEATTDKGHFLVFVPDPKQLPDLPGGLGLDDQERIVFSSLAAAVEKMDGVLIAAHPYDRSVDAAPGDAVVQLGGLAALEVQNARRSETINELAEEVAAGMGLPGVAGSDARTNLDDIGKVASLVNKPLESEADLIGHIRSFDIWPVVIGQKPAPKPRRDDRGGRPRSDSDRGRGRRDARGGGRGGRDDRRGRGRGRDRSDSGSRDKPRGDSKKD